MESQRLDDKLVDVSYTEDDINWFMSKEQFAAFLEAVQKDESLKSKLMEADDFISICSIAESSGFKISAEDFQSYEFPEELSDDELAGAAGGFGGLAGALPPGMNAIKNIVPGIDPNKLVLNFNGDINFNNDISINL